MRTYRYLITLLLCLLGPLAFASNSSLNNSAQAQSSSPQNKGYIEVATFSGKEVTNSPQVISRISVYEIHDDDSVTPDHEYSGLPYYSSFTFTGPPDADWLILEGNFNSYVINGNQVTFYGVQDWLHFVYRTNLFVDRMTDQLAFGVISRLDSPTDVNASITYPAYYEVLTVSPTGYTIPADGRINWSFTGTTEYTLTADFSGMGEDRPLLDLPVDYSGRGLYSSVGFTTAFNTRITSKFDHRYPNSYDTYFLSYSGLEVSDPPQVQCIFGFNCYDGHDAYDFDDLCPNQSCTNASAVYPAADGDIIQSQTGWNSVLGCRITIDHENEWTTVYAHLRDSQNNHTCDGILHRSGNITRFEQIGIIGGTGSGGGGPNNTHLHFVVKHNGIVADPSGWEPNPSVSPDPWAEHPNGTSSYPMWLYSIRTTQAFAPDSGGELTSPTHQVLVSIPANFYDEELIFNLSNESVANTASHLLNTGHSFSLTAQDNIGNFIHQLNEPLTIQIDFSLTELEGINTDTLSIYTWDEDKSSWMPLTTTIILTNYTATTQVDHLSIFALLGNSENVIYLPLVLD